ncbi:MAG TPA: signal peptidase I [Clostridia bacterium]|nr:signal peptidase I [Clostridia bacterium]
MTLQWFLSRTVRHATAMRKHVQKLLNHQRDILTPQAVETIQASINGVRAVLASRAPKAELEQSMQRLEQTTTKWLKPYPHPVWRENVEVLLVALAIAMGIRTFFLQPFKIPTGSMQPTLYGVTSIPDYTRGWDPAAPPGTIPDLKIPAGLDRVREWFAGVSYVQIRSKVDGQLQVVNPPFRILIFSLFQTLKIGGVTHWVLFPPDYGATSLPQRAGLRPDQSFRKGQEVVRMKVVAGDHLFVDRFTYNFRPPNRGEIIVFETRGIPEDMREASPVPIPGDQFYIKRLVGLGGETLEIGEDRHLFVNGRRLDASVPHFEHIYSFDSKAAPSDSVYSGHTPLSAPYFQHRPEGVLIPKGQYMVMGDNTVSSLDSRYWGPFPAKYVIGKAFFAYWPLTSRFGCGYHR